MELPVEGILLQLGRDDAKKLFGSREDDARVAIVQSLLRSSAIRVSLQGVWSEIQAALDPWPLDDSLLAQTLTGGRSLAAPPRIISLVRPDLVRPLAAQLATLTETAWSRRSYPPQLWPLVAEIAKLYEVSAASGAAVLFVAEPTN